MIFRAVTEQDNSLISSFATEGENSCENTFVNLFVWQKTYNNELCVLDGRLFVRSSVDGEHFYALPLGKDLKGGVEKLRNYCGKYPNFWAQDGENFRQFKENFSDKYIIQEDRDTFDYLYEREALATLSGKKYHSKRNHISAFSAANDWQYKSITPEILPKVKECANAWYLENRSRMDEHMKAEQQSIFFLLDNMERFGILGGAVVLNEKVVAFALGSPINRNAFDIHFEKALSDYAGAYAVINREFAKNEISQYKYVNREDDLGLEGLRKAKLSYRPVALIGKYVCTPRCNNG